MVGEMEMSESKHNDVVVLSVSGRVDASNAGMFESRLLGVIEAGNHRVLVDCGALDYVSSAGLRALLMAAKRVRASKGVVALAALKPQIREVFEIAGFAAVFQVFQDRAAALAKL